MQFSDALDLPAWHARLAGSGRVQIPDILHPEAALRLRACLANEVRWTCAYREAGRSRTLDADRYAALDDGARLALLERAYAEARGGAYQFVYDSYMMVTAYLEARDPGLLLHRALEWLNAPGTLAWWRQLTGDAGIVRVSAQATRYRPGHFLRPHNDHDAAEGRRYAYVLNLGQGWQADFGGLLQFLGDDGSVSATLHPHYNSLNLFRVPQQHCVSQVAAYATGERLAITGWLEG